jgi:hypothetical protein
MNLTHALSRFVQITSKKKSWAHNMKDLGIKSFYRHDHKVNRKKKDRQDKQKRI